MRVEYGARVLFSDLSFSVSPKERVGLAGHNGAGKSTLIKCIAGAIEPAAGHLSHAKDYKIGYLPQEGIHISGISLWDETATAFAEANQLQQEIDDYSAKLETLDPRDELYSEILEKIGDAEIKLEHYDPNRIKPKISAVLMGLGFSQDDFTRDCSEFSGGWQMRIAMAKLFLSEPDCLLLDEPTNHLDLSSQLWVESYLHNYPGSIIIISHDLALLDALTTRTIAFHHGRAEQYSGNYSFYVKESALRKEILLKQYKAQQREIQKTEDFINRFRAKATKAAQVQSRIKQLAKIERITIEEDDATMNFAFPPPPNSTQSVATLENAGQQYGDLKIFEDFTIEITQGQKIAIVGPNGAGKSTFCRLITGEEAPTTGTHTLGRKTLPSFFSQNHADELDPEATILETVEAAASRDAAPQARTILGCFLFKGDDVFKKVGVLSGGERSRVALVSMLLRPANFLILDEPTNHLDVQSQAVLQHAIQHYPGTVLIVSHNRQFLDPIVEQTLEFRPKHTPRLIHGNISYYLDKIEAEEKAASGNSSNSSSNKPLKLEKNRTAEGNGNQKNSNLSDSETRQSLGEGGQRLNKKERRKLEADKRQKRNTVLKPLQKDLETTEAQIAQIEAAQATLTEQLNSPEVTGDPQKLQETTKAFQSLAKQLEKVYSKWTELSDSIEKLEAELS